MKPYSKDLRLKVLAAVDRGAVSTATVSRAFKRLGLPLKKVPPAACERDEEQRALWRKEAQRIDSKRLVFVDECGTHTSMRRLYGGASGCAAAWTPASAKDYVLILLFIKYAGKRHAMIELPESGSFKDMVTLRGDKEIGEKKRSSVVWPRRMIGRESSMRRITTTKTSSVAGVDCRAH